MKQIDDEIAVCNTYHSKWKPKNAKTWEKATLYIQMNKELRTKIGKLVENIELVMKKSQEVSKEKFM